MTTQQIDNYLEYIQAVEEAYKIPRPEPYKYSEDQEEEVIPEENSEEN